MIGLGSSIRDCEEGTIGGDIPACGQKVEAEEVAQVTWLLGGGAEVC